MNDETKDIELAATLVCSFLSGQGRETWNASTTVSFKNGVVAFARRVGSESRTTLFVQPIQSATLDPKVREAITQPREPNATTHFSDLKAMPQNEWGFSLLPITAEGRRQAQNAKSKLTAAARDTLTDDDRNWLDLECFSSGHILSVPVSFLGSPLLVCYFDCKLTNPNSGIAEELKKIIYHRVVPPLSSLLAAHTVLQLSQVARDIIFEEIHDLASAQRGLIQEAAGLLLAKSAMFAGSVVVGECELLRPVRSGLMLPENHTQSNTAGQWKLELPSFYTFTGEAVQESKAIAGVSELQKRITSQIEDSLDLLQRAAQWQGQERAAVANRVFGQIKGDVEELLRHTDAARRSALRIESVMHPAREAFLKHHDQLQHLFPTKKTTYCFGVKKNSSGTALVSGIETDEEGLKSNGYETRPFEPVHSSENVKRAKWDDYREFLALYGNAYSLELLKRFSAADIPIDGNEDKHAQKLFLLLKLIMQRPQASPDRVYGLQLALACAAAWDGVEGKEVSFHSASGESAHFLEGTSPNGLRLVNAFALSDANFSDRPERAFLLAESGTTGQLIGSAIQLIAEELNPSEPDERSVVADKVFIHQTPQWLEMLIECTGCFETPEKKLNVGEITSIRGLRSQIENLCRASGQRQPVFVPMPLAVKPGVTPKEQAEVLRTVRKRFTIGYDQANRKTLWFLCFPAAGTYKR